MKFNYSSMKKILLILISAIFLSVSANSQIDVGFRVAPTLSILRSDFSTAERYLPGLNAGMFFQLPIGKNFFVQPEFSYLLKGSNYADQGNQDYKVQLHDLSLPVLFGYNATNRLRAVAGPQVDYLLRASTKTNGESIDATSLYQRFELSALVGLCYKIKKRLWIDFRYSTGLSYLSKIDVQDAQGNITDTYKTRSSVFVLGLSYVIR